MRESAILSADKLGALLHGRAVDLFRLEGVDETDQEWHLGQISVDKTEPYFRWGMGFGLSNTSRFRKEPFTSADRGEIVAVVFHQFDTEEHDKPVAEYLAGWVEKEREAELDKWIEFMNGQIAERLRDQKP